MVKITTTVSENGTLTIGIAGRLTAEACHVVDQVVNDTRKRHQQVRVDLAGITLIDQASVEYLVHLRRLAIELVHLPSYVSCWVEQVWSRAESGESS